METTYTVSLTFENISAKTPLEAAQILSEWLKDGAENMVYDVKDKQTNKKHVIDLEEYGDDLENPETNLFNP